MMESIEYAKVAMAKARTDVEKACASKEDRNKVVSKASEVVNALLEPASQVANLLDGICASFPLCKLASNTLCVASPLYLFRFHLARALVKLEIGRRENDERMVLLSVGYSSSLSDITVIRNCCYLQLQETALANLGTLSPGFQDVTTLTRPLEILLQHFTELIEEFGRFCEYVYQGIRH